MKSRKKKDKITYSSCRRTRRQDGLRMKCLREYTFRSFADTLDSRFSKHTAYSIFRQGAESEMTYGMLRRYARSGASYLMHLGYAKGDRIAIFGESCPNWMAMYLSIAYFGAIAVPILPDFSKNEAEAILKHAEVRGVCVNAKHYAKVRDAADELGLDVFRMDDLFHVRKEEGVSFAELAGYSLKDYKANPMALDGSMPSEGDIASIIYTSGTTGSSKGVVLTHMNLLRCADLNTDVYTRIGTKDRVLSILPMSHVYEFTIGQLLPMLRGASITFLGKPPAVSVLLPALAEVRPTIMLTVPLLIEKVYKSAVAPVLKGDSRIGKLSRSRLFSSFVYRTIGRKVLSTFGHKIKFFGIGGAPLDKEVEEFLYRAHFPYSIGYGLTETSPLIAGCPPRHSKQKPGYIGRVVEDDDVILLDTNKEGVGEIAVKGPNVMLGYYKRPDLDKEAFTPDGYFRTGDLGYLDRKGMLAIRGRVKTMILGPGGENIYPETIETIINNLNFVEESLVVPENGGLLALVKIDVNLMAESMKISIGEAKEEARKYVAEIRKLVNSQVSSYSKLSEAQLQEEPFDRTPTQKIKRFLYPKKKDDKEEKRK